MSERYRPVTPNDALYAQVYAERFGRPPLWEYHQSDAEDLADALEATEGERKRRHRNGTALP